MDVDTHFWLCEHFFLFVENEKIMEMVRGFLVLYDTTHKDYMRSKLKDDLLENIAKEY